MFRFSFSCTYKVKPFISPFMEVSGVGDPPLLLTLVYTCYQTSIYCKKTVKLVLHENIVQRYKYKQTNHYLTLQKEGPATRFTNIAYVQYYRNSSLKLA